MNTRISQVAVANPGSSYTQDEVLDMLGLVGNEFAERIFGSCGVRKRHFELSPEVLMSRMQDRTPETERQLLDLATLAIDQLDIDPDEIGTVITASYYSLGGPTLAHRLLDYYELDPGIDKYHIVGVGCASAVPLFKLASQSLRDQPGKKALVVAAESITGFITPVGPDDEKVKIVGSSLFGDGCAAAVMSNGNSSAGPALDGYKVHQVADSLGSVHFKLGSDDSYMQIGKDLPTIAEEQLGELTDAFLADAGLDRESIDHWLVHPGGRGIIEGVQKGLDLTDDQVSVSYDVLANYGNMGTPCSFYVLKGTIEQRKPEPGDTGLMVTIGPGVTVGLMLLRW
jgi:alkylresorcinol/alkylpyrone synthase